jgi:DNA-binding response OmpR family regulator
MNELIFVVDDEDDITALVSHHLTKSGFRVEEFLDGKGLIAALKGRTPDLLVLDLMLPDIDGIDICKQMKNTEQHASIPIIMLTAKAEETDRILGLELGADDYVVKPFSPKELVARVRAVLRRRVSRQETKKIVIDDHLEMDLQKYVVTRDGDRIDLTTTEFRILQLLAGKMGWVFSREAILEHLWGSDKYVLDRTVDVHVRHLRAKLGDYGGIIKNVRGVGYKLEI